MSQFSSSFWDVYIVVAAIASAIGCGLFLGGAPAASEAVEPRAQAGGERS